MPDKKRKWVMQTAEYGGWQEVREVGQFTLTVERGDGGEGGQRCYCWEVKPKRGKWYVWGHEQYDDVAKTKAMAMARQLEAGRIALRDRRKPRADPELDETE